MPISAVTTALAQAFKRACAAFGLGRYLYFLPQVWCDYDAEKRRIVNPPRLPLWALPEAEKQALLEARASFRPQPTPQAEPEPEPQPAPAEESTNAEPVNPGEVMVHFGKMNGKTLAQVWAEGKAGQGWVRWCANVDGKGFDPKGKPENTHLQRMARAFLTLNAVHAG